MFIFDERGLLPAGEIIAMDLGEIEANFVTNFPDSLTRKTLFINYLRYLEDFRKRISSQFEQWLNGSFVTSKSNPKDIDLVTFLDYKTYQKQEKYLDKYWTFSLENEGLDAYFVQVYPQNHIKYPEYLENIKHWKYLYTNLKTENKILENRKGFVKLKI